jgi:ubiquinone/menaquinone biosynthesis C-methylase UbiE
MADIDLQLLAQNLRKPEGEFGVEVGVMMNEGNAALNMHTRIQLDPSEGDNILEIGMGNGKFVNDILAFHPSIKYTGIDYSDLMVAESEKANASSIEQGRAKFIVGNADHLPFDDNTFTKIFTVNTIYFWDDHTAALAEIRRVLIPNGWLHIAVYSKPFMQGMPFTKYNFRLFENEEIQIMLNKDGFRFDRLTEHREDSVWTDNIEGYNILIFSAQKQ